MRRACHAANLARERERSVETSPDRNVSNAVTTPSSPKGLAFHEAQPSLAIKGGGKRRGRAPRRTGHNLLLRFSTRREDTLRFLHDPAVPFTNNEAERDGRMMKLRQKISGGFRSLEGAIDFAAIRSFISTAKKTGLENHRRLDHPSRKSREIPAPRVIRLKNLGSYPLTLIVAFSRRAYDRGLRASRALRSRGARFAFSTYRPTTFIVFQPPACMIGNTPSPDTIRSCAAPTRIE